MSTKYSVGDLIHQIKHKQIMYVINMYSLAHCGDPNTYELMVRYMHDYDSGEHHIRFTDWLDEEIKEGVTKHYSIVPGATNESNI